jgi:ribosomal protein S2
MIAKITELEEERLDKLAEQEYLINRKVEEQLQKYHTGVKMENFGESLQSR